MPISSMVIPLRMKGVKVHFFLYTCVFWLKPVFFLGCFIGGDLMVYYGILWKKGGAGRKGVMEEWSREKESGEWRVGESQAESRKLHAAS